MSALMYHDIVTAAAAHSSGFPGGDAALYKVAPAHFARQIAALARLPPAARPIITFDDGGASAMQAADELEARGLTGFFFVTADYIGAPGFVSERDIRELHGRGHVIGSHSCSHPLQMARCSWDRLAHEWVRSRAVLREAIGEDVIAASVPGGDFSSQVADVVRMAGFRQLFTSEPTCSPQLVRGLHIYGRYVIRRSTSVRTALDLATGHGYARAQQRILWSMKKATKRIGGTPYVSLRRLVLGGTLK